jgi:hypothetical protein
MMKTLLAMVLLGGSGLVIAQVDSPVISAELTLLPATTVLERDRVAVLGNYAVLTKASALAYASAQIVSGEQLLVVVDHSSGRLGTTDGGIVVYLHSADSLDGLAADYGLIVNHVFTTSPAGVLAPESRETAVTYLARLSDDSRVISAELNVNFYQEQYH